MPDKETDLAIRMFRKIFGGLAGGLVGMIIPVYPIMNLL